MEIKKLVEDAITSMMKTATKNRIRTSKVLEEIADFETCLSEHKNVIISRKMVFKGSLNAGIVHPREVFKETIEFIFGNRGT